MWHWGILIESAHTGRPTLGIDFFDPVMVDGCRAKYRMGRRRGKRCEGDATRYEFPDDVAAVVVDPPYGRNSPSDEKLIEDMLANIRQQSSSCNLVVILPVPPGAIISIKKLHPTSSCLWL